MIILFDFDKDPEEEFRKYEAPLKHDVSKSIFMIEPLSWYEAYKNKKYEAMINNAINHSTIKGEIVLLPAYYGVLSYLIQSDKLKSSCYIATPQGISDFEYNTSINMEDVLMKTKGYAIDYPHYDKFMTHVKELAKKYDQGDYWKWFAFDHGLF